jgi:Fibronectin type III domain
VDRAGKRPGVASKKQVLGVVLAGALLYGVAGCGMPSVEAEPAAAVPTAQAAPTGVTAKVSGTAVNVTWKAPKVAAAVTGYKVYLDSQDPITVPASTLSYRFTGFTPGTKHYVQVQAITRGDPSVPVGVQVSLAFPPGKAVTAPATASATAAPTAGPWAASSAQPASPAPAAPTQTTSAPAAQPTTSGTPVPTASPTSTVQVSGGATMVLQLNSSLQSTWPASCDDVVPGPAEIRDGSNNLLTTTALTNAKTVTRDVLADTNTLSLACHYTFSASVPRSSTYVLQLGGNWGSAQYTTYSAKPTVEVSLADVVAGTVPELNLTYIE